MLKKITHGFLIGLAASAVAAAFWFTGLLNWVEWPLWDLRERTLAKPSSESQKIKLVLIDQTSLDWGDDVRGWSWPWPRVTYAVILDFCKRGGAKVVIFDMIFSEPSSTSGDDAAFIRSIAKHRRFVGTVVLGYNLGPNANTNWPINVAAGGVNVAGINDFVSKPARQSLTMPVASFPIAMIASNCDMFANVYVAPDSDKVIRRTALFRMFNGRVLPSLGLAAYCVVNTNEPLNISDNTLRIGSTTVPMDKTGKAILRYRGASQTHTAYSAQSVIQSELRARGDEEGKPVLDPEVFRDKYVFVGLSAPGLMDVRATPISASYPGTEINATMLDNLLANDFISDVGPGTVVLCILAFAFAAGLLGRVCSKPWQTVVLFVVLPVLPITLGFVAYSAGYWLPVSPPVTAMLFSLVGAVITNYALEGRQKRVIKTAFKQYLSPVLVERLAEHPEQLRLGGETRELTIFFSDVRGFTSISETLPPDRLTALLNDYLTAMSDVIMAQGGYIDKYEGDAVIAFWNAPLDLPGHANNGVRAALLCQKLLSEELRATLKQRYSKEMYCRIGVNTGPVVVGNMGSTQRFNYTFLGDAGNLASRLEGINKQFGTNIMISEFTAVKLGDEFALREISRVTVVGKKEPVRVFEPMFKADVLAQVETHKTFASGLQAFYAGRFEEAVSKFSEIADKDAPAEMYVKKCRSLISHPTPQWNGVWEITEK